MNDTHYYEVNLRWNSATQGTINSPAIASKIDVKKATKLQKEIKEKWTAEHLSVAAVSSCLMSTFLLVADNSKLKFISFESNAVGKIEKIDSKFSLTEIVLKPTLFIPSIQNESKAIRVLEMSEKACAFANSIKTKITLESIITIK
ncbi:MAG TPA: OsmC family protein [Chitinophagales bacterium]|nr:OsmC family protein [Chitinophagales bacterium]